MISKIYSKAVRRSLCKVMSKKPRIDYEQLSRRLMEVLARRGPTKGGELVEALNVSQPTLSRLIKHNQQKVLAVGSARTVSYMARRLMEELPSRIPIFEILSTHTDPRLLVVLHPVLPRGFWVEGSADGIESRLYGDLPYFLMDLHPSGFLGRLVPKQHPDEGFPLDVGLWSQWQTLIYLVNYGWDLPGNLIVGDPALRLYQEAKSNRQHQVVADGDRERIYPAVADEVLGYGIPGSSAGGEQPKFLANREKHGTTTPVLVKFSPLVRDLTSTRVADLLICEHLALQTLEAEGFVVARSELIRSGHRLFLEVERFDRVHSAFERRGVLSLRALDAEFVGFGEGWSAIVGELHTQGHVTADQLAQVRWLEAFGTVIANTDMHCGNLSFLVDGLDIVGLAPVYDMTCMRYAPQRGHLESRPLLLREGLCFPKGVLSAGMRFWKAASAHPWLSDDMKGIADANADLLRQRGQ